MLASCSKEWELRGGGGAGRANDLGDVIRRRQRIQRAHLLLVLQRRLWRQLEGAPIRCLFGSGVGGVCAAPSAFLW